MDNNQAENYKELCDLAQKKPDIERLSLSEYQDDFTADTLKFIATSFPKLTSLHVVLPYEDNRKPIYVDKALFPELKTISFEGCAFKVIHFDKSNTPKLESLSIGNTGHSVSYIYLDLPHLNHLSFEFVEFDDPSGFGASLSRCPNLESVYGYKVWGLGESKQVIKLPKCITFSLYRSDDLSRIIITAPKLKQLGLRACYGLDRVRLKPQTGSKVRVDLTNAVIDNESLEHLKTHPRVSKIKEPRLDEEVVDSEESEDESDDDEEVVEIDITQCHTCHGKESLKYCGRCKTVKYCSVDCQRKDWPTHKPKCVPIKKN